MYELLSSIYHGFIDHLLALTGLAFFLAILKLVFPIFMFFLKEITYRISERNSARRLHKLGLPLEVAKMKTKKIWRPDSESTFSSRLLDKLILLLSKKPKT